MSIGVLFENLEVCVVLGSSHVSLRFKLRSDACTMDHTSSLRQKAQIDFGLAALTGVPFAWTGARVPAASAFFCSFRTRSFFEMGMVTGRWYVV